MPEICLSTITKNPQEPHLGQTISTWLFDWHDLIYVLDFFKANEAREVYLSGETAELHPDFSKIVNYVRQRGFLPCIIVSGLTLPWLQQLVVRSSLMENVRFICRLTDSSPDLFANEAFNLPRWLAENLILEVLIIREYFDPTPFLQLIRRQGLKQELILNLVPCNDELTGPGLKPELYGSLARRFADSLDAFMDSGIFPVWRRGIPLCAFTDSDLGRVCKAGMNHKWRQGQDFVVYPDLSFSPFGVPSLRKRLSLLEMNSFADISQSIGKLAQGFLFRRCSVCSLRLRKLCDEGVYLNWAADLSPGKPL
jgi:hypothetical protein